MNRDEAALAQHMTQRCREVSSNLKFASSSTHLVVEVRKHNPESVAFLTKEVFNGDLDIVESDVRRWDLRQLSSGR